MGTVPTTKPLMEGFSAALAGEDLDACPDYGEGHFGIRAQAWRDGWHLAREHMLLAAVEAQLG